MGWGCYRKKKLDHGRPRNFTENLTHYISLKDTGAMRLLFYTRCNKRLNSASEQGVIDAMYRCVVGLSLVASISVLLSGCLTVRACGGTELVVQGRVIDGATDSGLAGVPVLVTFGSGKRKLLDDFECVVSDQIGVVDFKGRVSWTSHYGPVGMLKRRLERNDDCMSTLSVELRYPGYDSHIFTYTGDDILRSTDNPFRVELGEIKLEPTDGRDRP